jgi:hypothetical protein
MSISQTNQVMPFPLGGSDDTQSTTRYLPVPTAATLKRRSLFGIPLRSFLTNEVVDDATLTDYINMSISEIEHELDLYITPTTFQERYDYNREMQLFSFGYLKLNHSPILNVTKFQLSFNNGVAGTTPLVDVPLEFVHVQPQDSTIQLVPASGVGLSGFIASAYSGLGFHAFSSQSFTQWPGAIFVEYTAGFPADKVPALLCGLIESLAAYKFLSVMGPILFPHNSIGISIDGTSQSVGTLGPGFLQNRLSDLEKIIQSQKEAARGYYQKRFLISYL